MSRAGNEITKIKRRITVANRIYYSSLLIIRCKDVHRLTKMRIYKIMIRSVLCYGCKTWVLMRASEKQSTRRNPFVLAETFLGSIGCRMN